MTTSTQNATNSPIEALYLWGARFIGGMLLIGIVMHVGRLLAGASIDVLSDVTNIWPSVVLICLAIAPVMSLTVAGLAWVYRNRRDVAGWMALATAMFLSSLWVLK